MESQAKVRKGSMKEGIGKVILGILIVVPTLICATQFERVFLVALEVSGGFGDSILNGLIPVIMVWIGRYYLNLGKASHFKLPGGRVLLSFVFAFFLCALILEIRLQTGQSATIYEPFEAPIHNVKLVEAE